MPILNERIKLAISNAEGTNTLPIWVDVACGGSVVVFEYRLNEDDEFGCLVTHQTKHITGRSQPTNVSLIYKSMRLVQGMVVADGGRIADCTLRKISKAIAPVADHVKNFYNDVYDLETFRKELRSLSVST